jgi:PDZ domain-containing protein
VLAPGDAIVRVGTAPIRGLADLPPAFRHVKPGSPVSVRFVRAGRVRSARIVTVAGPHGARLGVAVRVQQPRAQLPVPVRYLMGGIAGSSGGLMFALDIYAELRPGRARGSVAGTGTIASDGHVGPIEGAEQKLIAARRVGAEIFLVPKENYASVAHETGIRVVPVATFREALAAIGD